MIKYIVDRKADEFRTSGVPFDLAVTCCCCLSQYLWLCLGHPLFFLCLLCAWVRSFVCVCVYCVCACAWFVGSSITMTVAVAGLSAPLSISAISLSLFLYLHLRLLYLCLCLVCWLLHCFVCSCAWVVHSSVCVYYMPGSVPPSASAFAMYLYLCLVCRLFCLRLLCLWLCQKH